MSNWQDIVLAITVFAFNIALIPSVISSQKPRMLTSLTTGLFIIPQLVVFVSLSLWYAFVMALINCLLWFTLAMQRYIQMKKKQRFNL